MVALPLAGVGSDRPRLQSRPAADLNAFFNTEVFRVFHRVPFGSAGPRKVGKVDGLQLHPILWIAFHRELLPLDHPKHVILDDDNFDRQ